MRYTISGLANACQTYIDCATVCDMDDGGAAFPKYFGGNRDLAPGEEAGMTLRDYFAAQAFPPLVWRELSAAAGSGFLGDYAKQAAVNAYAFADAMLAERAK